MLNANGARELAYVVRIDDIQPIVGRDRVECAVVGAWTIMVRKGQFKPGDLGIYFEIDSQVPEKEPFMFLESKHFKIKTQKYALKNENGEKCGQFWSQGLLMHPSDFDWMYNVAEADRDCIIDSNGVVHYADDESRFLTQQLGVIYAEPEDNKRKANSADKYKSMAQRNKKLFSHQPFRWLMQRDWGKKLLFAVFGRKRDKKSAWPSWVVKTDEERIQNLAHIYSNYRNEKWIATEKLDGTSTTFTMRRKKGIFRDNYEFLVCSRNVVFDKPDKKCFYETNVYTEMAEKYPIEKFLRFWLDLYPDIEWVTIQGETYGEGIQKRDYGLNRHRFAAFNLIDSRRGRYGSAAAAKILIGNDIPFVPIIGEMVTLPETIPELLEQATGNSKIDGGMREGIVFRSIDGSKSFKAVSNEFLMKYHNG